jgi:hypothetical protein
MGARVEKPPGYQAPLLSCGLLRIRGGQRAAPRLVADVGVLLAHAHHHALVARAAHDGREHRARHQGVMEREREERGQSCCRQKASSEEGKTAAVDVCTWERARELLSCSCLVTSGVERARVRREMGGEKEEKATTSCDRSGRRKKKQKASTTPRGRGRSRPAVRRPVSHQGRFISVQRRGGSRARPFACTTRQDGPRP